MGEKIANVLEKLTAVDPDKADRANESLGVAAAALKAVCLNWAALRTPPRCRKKCEDIKTNVDRLYEQLVDIDAQVSTSEIDPSAPQRPGPIK